MRIPTVPAAAARRLLLGAQGLLDDPDRPASTARLRALVRQLAFVQLDSINAVARAQHLTLFTRMHRYRPKQLDTLLERDRFLFEHWTHDASAIPVEWYAHWHHRFRRSSAHIEANDWWQGRLGPRPKKVLDEVRARVREGGEARAQDFVRSGGGARAQSGFWEWTPHKAALEYLWRTGELAVSRRVHFHKVYDLTERVLPVVHAQPVSLPDDHLDWACRTALDRLGAATPRELAGFWGAVSLAEARAWCASELREKRLLIVNVEAEREQPPEAAYAPLDWETRLAALPEAPREVRLLCPFDPVLRDRARALRLFGFDYRFEAFVPRAKRRYGYYVMPVLEGERMIGRVDPRFDRARRALDVQGVWWEAGVTKTPTRRKALETALWELARWLGAEKLEIHS